MRQRSFLKRYLINLGILLLAFLGLCALIGAVVWGMINFGLWVFFVFMFVLLAALALAGTVED